MLPMDGAGSSRPGEDAGVGVADDVAGDQRLGGEYSMMPFIGPSAAALSNCPGGAGYLEITLIEEARVQGRAEQAVNANGKTTCGGVFGVLRSMKDLVFVPE